MSQRSQNNGSIYSMFGIIKNHPCSQAMDAHQMPFIERNVLNKTLNDNHSSIDTILPYLLTDVVVLVVLIPRRSAVKDFIADLDDL